MKARTILPALALLAAGAAACAPERILELEREAEGRLETETYPPLLPLEEMLETGERNPGQAEGSP